MHLNNMEVKHMIKEIYARLDFLTMFLSQVNSLIQDTISILEFLKEDIEKKGGDEDENEENKCPKNDV